MEGCNIYFLTVVLIKRHSTNKWIFPKLKCSGGRVKVELALFNYATKWDTKQNGFG